jgi:branched-chain amino acid transport system ATP-binding protein
VPEGRQIFPDLSVLENIRVAERRPARIWPVSRLFGLFPALRERGANKGSQLSGGEQQMLAIGRALMQRPKLLLLDEPSLGLAPLIIRQIFEAIRRINAIDGVTILLVEQNALQALNAADRGYVLQTGRIVHAGLAETLLSMPEIREAYLEGLAL